MTSGTTRVLAGVVMVAVAAGCAGASTGDVLVERRTDTGEGASPPAVPETTTAPAAPPATSPEQRLSIEDALMDDGDVGEPWELQHRDGERPGFGAGPNQTDCAPYWRYEQRYDLAGGAALWWRSGGNVDHEVYRAADSAAAADFLATMRALPELCPVTRWSENDSFRIEPVDLGHAEIVGVEFVDGNPQDLHHVAFSVRGDLISVVSVVQWPTFPEGEFPHTSTDDVARWAARAHERLTAAGAVPPPTTTTIAPPSTNAVDPPPDPNGPARFLLSDSDLVDLPGWNVDTPRLHEYSDDSDDTLLADCPTRSSLAQLARLFAVEVDLSHESSYETGWQYVGEAADEGAAEELLTAFARLADCDTRDEPGSVRLGGGSLDLPGTPVAVLDLTLGDPVGEGEWFRIYVATAGPRVTVLAFSLTDLSPTAVDQLERVVEIAATKLAG